MVKGLGRVVITGMSAITSLGNTSDEFWKNIIAGKAGLTLLQNLTPPTLKQNLQGR